MDWLEALPRHPCGRLHPPVLSTAALWSQCKPGFCDKDKDCKNWEVRALGRNLDLEPWIVNLKIPEP